MLATSERKNRNAKKGINVAFLKCTVQPSVFPHECGVFFQGINGEYESLIDTKLIHSCDAEDGQTQFGWVKVSVIQKDDSTGGVLVELPRQVVMGGRRIWVPESEVEYGSPLPASNQKTS